MSAIATTLIIFCALLRLTSADCSQRPSVITSLPSFECSILSNDHNVQSLTEAFFPANRRQALVVEVHYYVNRTVHPLYPEAENARPADYVYLWFASPVLAFIEPRFLSGLSLNTLTLDYSYAHIVIVPFVTDDEDWIRGILTNGTTWLKSYAEMRGSEIRGASQGFCGYKPDYHNDDYFLYNAGRTYKYYVGFLGVSLVTLVTLTIILIPTVVHGQYKTFHNKAIQPRKDKQRFRFRNLVCGFISVLALFVVGVYVYGLHHTVTFGLRWKTGYSFIYPMIITGAVVLPGVAVIAAAFIVKKSNDDETLIPIPCLLYFLLGQLHSVDSPPTSGSRQKKVLIIWQVIGVWVIMASAVAGSFFLCGILLGLFVDPIQVLATLGIYISVAICAILAFASVFETTDEIHMKRNNRESMCFTCMAFTFQCVVFALALTFLGIFGYTYATIVLFAGGGDEIGLFSSFGELLPVVFVSVITWMFKYELGKYYE